MTGPDDAVRAEHARWAGILEKAKDSFLADPPPLRPWAAIIVPKAAQNARWMGVARTWPDRLTAPLQIGPMTLTSVPTWVTQAHPHPDDISVMLGVGYWPILVTGNAPGYFRAGARQAAGRDLLLLQQLLTLVTARSWQRGRQPWLMERENEEEDFLAHWLEGMAGWSLGDQMPAPEPTTLALPEWLDEAWRKVTAARRFPNALAAYGRAFEHFTEDISSDAGARFVAVVEALAGTRSPSQAKEEVRDFLVAADKSSSLTTKEAEQAAEHLLMYELRSSTVHTGRLHGPEALGGLELGMVSADGDPSRTHHMMTGNLQHLCRNMLIHQLGGPLHSADPILRELKEIQSGVITLAPPMPK
ncbi:hypothetical protein ACFW7J_06605 [Streptomyces sp. NPDC059525]|uniref:hypothetical protein n=1 Tax=Streptomyces sp. NPDC059525 TaxID=3346857 RepID=UPI0036B9F1FD